MPRRKRKLTRRLVLLAIVVLFVAGALVGGKMLYDKGLSREGVLAKAQRAFREGRFAEAAALADETLKSQTDNVAVRELLLDALVQGEQYDEARRRAEKFFADGPGNEFAGEHLCHLAMRNHDLDEADRIARQLVDTRPDTAYRLIGFLQDLRGLMNDDWRLRFAAASTMRNLASLTKSETVRANALIFSATIQLEVAKLHSTPRGVIRQARGDLKAAEAASLRARQLDRSFNYDLAMGRIRALSGDESEAEFGARMLRSFTSGVARSETAITALASYHLRRGSWNDAGTLIKEIKDPYCWYRAFWNVRDAGQTDLALGMLETSPHEDPIDRELLRAQVLAGSGDEAQKKEGAELLAGFVRDSEAEPVRVLRALLALASKIGLDTARETAREAKLEESGDPRIRALLATMLAASETDRELGMEMIKSVVNDAEDDSGSDAERIFSSATGAALEGWLNARVAKGGESAYQYRLRRAMTLLAKARSLEGKPEAEQLKQRIRADIDVLLQGADTTKFTLVGAFQLASAIGATELAGRCLGRAVLMDGSPTQLDQRILRLAMRLSDEEAARQLAAGVRAVAENSPAAAYLRVLAKGIETRAANLAELGAAFEKAAAEEGSAVQAGDIAANLALDANDLDRAEQLARAVLARDADHVGCVEVIGETLRRRGKYQEMLDLFAPYADREDGFGITQVVGALLRLDRTDEALTQARKLVGLFPRAPAAHVLLARVYLDVGERRKALSVLSMAPLSPPIAHMRAELLQEFGDDAMAEQILHGLLVSSKYTDHKAWTGLRDVLRRNDRLAEFTALTGKVLRAKSIQLADGTRSFLHMLRGNAFELEGKLPEAMRDYEDALRLNPGDWRAFNNAAWHIATLRPARIETARKYVDRALDLVKNDPAHDRSGMPTLYDTAAEVYATQGEFDRALDFMDNALALKPAGKVAGYMVHKARILLRAEREAEAKALLERVREDHGNDRAANAARDLLAAIARKNQPDEDEGATKPADSGVKKKEAANG
jgi:tetratricopeptide (TPR) repeat protein